MRDRDQALEQGPRLAPKPPLLLLRRERQAAAPDRPARDEALRARPAGDRELLRERVAVDLAAAEQGPVERRRRGRGAVDRLAAGVLQLQQVADVQLPRGLDDQIRERVIERGVALALEPVDERLEDQRQPFSMTVLRGPRNEFGLAGRALVVVGPVPQEQL